MNTQTFSEYYVYVHVYSDGDVFMLPCDQQSGTFPTTEQLRLELQRVQKKGGAVLYSAEDASPESRSTVLEVSSLILDSDVDVQMVEPHPETYGYRQSYSPYLERAMEAAEMDVAGLRRYLNDAKRSLDEARPGSQLHRERVLLCEVLNKRLRLAKRARAKLTSVHLQLFMEAEDAERMV